MNNKEYQANYDLYIQEVEQTNTNWFDIDLNVQIGLSKEDEEKLLKKKFAIQNTKIK
jgi:hypothetical protein